MRWAWCSMPCHERKEEHVGMPQQASTIMSANQAEQSSQMQGNVATQKQSEDILPLPKWLTRVYYIFPIVLYVPDMLFNFYVYSDGILDKGSGFDVTKLFYYVLYAFLAVGIVGMAWLLSVLAPWHWGRGNHFQSIMCWGGVFIATAITTWNSLAYRSNGFVSFKTDEWFGSVFNVNIHNFSPTMVLVAVAPPFWGLFWALVQPSEQRKSMAEEREGHVMKLERMRQEAEIKRLKAESNAQIREAQLKGLAATVRSARSQLGTTTNPQMTTVTVEQQEAVPAERVVALPTGSIRRLSDRRNMNAGNGEMTESGEHEIVRGASSMSYSVASPARNDVFEAPDGYTPAQGTLMGSNTGEQDIMATSRPGRSNSTLLRNYADGEHVMREVDSHVNRMRTLGMKVTIKTFAEHRNIELPHAKQLLAKWKEWKQVQQDESQLEVAE